MLPRPVLRRLRTVVKLFSSAGHQTQGSQQQLRFLAAQGNPPASPPASPQATPILPAAVPHQAALLLDGKAVATQWLSELAAEVQQVTGLIHRPPGLAVVLVGSRPDSLLYVTRKQEACQKAGVTVTIHRLPETVSQAALETAVQHLCASPDVDGVLIQLPLPSHLCEESVMEHLDPRKDVDGFHPLNMGRMLMRGRVPRLVPCTPLGCMELLERSGVTVRGKTAVVLGDSNIVGTPLAALLRDTGAAAVTVCHQNSYREWFQSQEGSEDQRALADACLPRLPGPAHRTHLSDTTDSSTSGTNCQPPVSCLLGPGSFQPSALPSMTSAADILVVAVGVPRLVRRHWVKPGAVVIDVGINVVPQPPTSCEDDGCVGPQTGVAGGGGVCSQPPTASTSHSGAGAAGMGVPGQPGTATGQGSGSVAAGVVDPGSGSLGGPAAFAPGTYQVVGDVHFEEVSEVASAITPVPGGVGPMTIAAVLANTLRAARYHTGLLPW